MESLYVKKQDLISGRLLAGMTIVELLVAMIILAIGLLAALGMQATAMSYGARATNMTVASFFAESKVETLKGMTFEEVASVSNSTEYLTIDGDSCDSLGEPGCFFARTTTVTPNFPTSRSYEVSVMVQWAKSSKGSLVYDTVITADGF